LPLLKAIKEGVEKLTGSARPSWPEAEAAIRPRKPRCFGFIDDGVVPNSRLPLVIYRGAMRLTGASDRASVFEILFAHYGWKGSWRDGIYDFRHYHSQTHEVLGFARGTVQVRFGGARGRIIWLKAGDVAVLPAGIAHERMNASSDLLVVGAYPTPSSYDECRASPEEHDPALERIMRVPPPKKDPVYGSEGPLVRLWLKHHSGRLTRGRNRIGD
jgi:uncharacterized protein YjlB